MKKVKRSFICILSFVILSLGCINVYATSGIKAILDTRNTKLNSGREVEVILRLDNYERTDKEVNVYKATLVYNKNVFEEISESDFETLNDWEELKFNEDTGEFIAIHKTGSKSSEEIVKIKLKVKDNAEVGKEDIVIKDIVTSDGKKDMVVEELKATVDIIEDQTNEPGDSENESDDSKNEDSSDKEDSVLNPDNSIKEDLPQTGDTVVSDVKEEIMVEQAKPTINVIQNPQTGDTTNWILWFALIGVEATVVIIFMQKDKLKKIKYKNKKMIIFLIIGAISLQTVGTVAAATLSFSVKGELNGDGKIDYNDVNLLQYHLINQQQLSEDALKNADMNSDKAITVTDLSLLLKKVEKNLDYNIVLSDVEDNNYYLRKNEEVNLNFLGEVDYGAIIEKAIINNQEYEVNKAVDSNIYTVNVGTNDTSGIKEYHFTEVILNTGKKVDVDYTIKL